MQGAGALATTAITMAELYAGLRRPCLAASLPVDVIGLFVLLPTPQL
jgi:hypothetical protein